ncbi:phosphopyruvate hydratase [Lacrimispora sp.]|uniref:phosphopyruvate hydratase n=1 Tax=Lacrimispora sp. TaxID=2719234 RepID=UPI0028AD9E58|nr:phosphopyruvate hydratase [Lacrimispora sp.]
MLNGLDIIEITGRIVRDSWGYPGVEAEVILENGAHGRAAVSMGNNGSAEEQVRLVNDRLSESILFEDASDQGRIDRMLSQAGDENWAEVDGNQGVLAISMAVARAAGAGLHLPLYRYLGGTSAPVMPVPMMSMISGGGGDKGLDFHEIMIVPQGANSYSEGLRMGVEIYQALKRLLSISGFSTSTGDGGGFEPDMKNSEEALHYLMDSFKLTGYKPGEDVLVAINADADRLYEKENGTYCFSKESRKGGISINRAQKDMLAYYLRLSDGFPICAVMNGLWKEDLEGRKEMMKLLEHRTLLVSNDFAAANATIIRLEQAGTVSGALEMVEKARKAGHKVIVASDVKDTEESFIADMAAAVGADYVKSGAPCRGECTAKYNELLRIEEFYRKHGQTAVHFA